MNKLLIYSFIIISAAAVVIFALVANGILTHVQTGNVTPKGVNAILVKPLEIKIKSITANKTNDNNNTAKVGVAFDLHNPNQNTMLLDGIHYNVYSANLPITSGDIGTETQLDVVRGETSFPILGNSTITLKDVNTINRTSSINGIWDKIVEGQAIYVVKGTYSTKQAANLNYSPGLTEFNSTYP